MHRTEVLSTQEVSQIIVQTKLLYQRLKNNCSSKQRNKRITNIMFDAIRDYAVVRLLYSTGMTVGQICKLSLNDLDLAAHRIRVNGRPGTRYAAIWPRVEKALCQWLKVRNKSRVENGALFTTHLGNPIYSREVQRKVKLYSRLAGIQKQVTPKTFRHSIAAHLWKDGANVQFVASFLGVSLASAGGRHLPEVSFEELKKELAKLHIENW